MVKQSFLKNGMVFLREPGAWGCLFPSKSFGDRRIVPPSMCVSFEETRGAVEQPLPALGKLSHGICIESISKQPYLAFRHAWPLPTALAKY